MTDPTTDVAGADAQGGDSVSQADVAKNLKNDAHALVAKIEGTKTITEASSSLENAKFAVISAIQYLEKHFEELAAKVEGKSSDETADADAPAGDTPPAGA